MSFTFVPPKIFRYVTWSNTNWPQAKAGCTQKQRQAPGPDSATYQRAAPPTHVGEAEGPGQRRDQLVETNEFFVPRHPPAPLPAFPPPAAV